MRAALAIAAVELQRFVKDKGNVFFTFIFPLMLVFVLGSQFGGSGSSGSVTVSGPSSDLRTAVAEQLEDGEVSVQFADHDDMLEQVARGRVDAGLVVTPEAAEAFSQGGTAQLEMIAGSSSTSMAAQQRVQVTVSNLDLRRIQVGALGDVGVSEADAAQALDAATGQVSEPTIEVRSVDELAQEFQGLGQFDLGASSQLLLFTFLTSLAGASTLINARRQGVLARTLASPVSTVQAIAGQSFGRWVIAFFQGAYIMQATWLIFDVDWGNLWLSLLVLSVFALVAAGAAMVLGSVLDNEGAAVGAGVGIGLVLAAIGGGMLPLELFSDTMRQVAHVTPHAWGYDAFAQIQRHDGGLVDILPQLGVLTAMAVLVLVLGAWTLRRSMARSM
ncbi:ABC transporter permease [Ornithinimicrobium cryptoxanthini]|uniref:ABC transporter permease n=1 Tax=Ornithinimicrobium cryptoxanthini TaxID=2934161 RepID=A0ABY4YLJ2_9MICO|nr:ABC transporter permease [Ornithinimicrobium cryptoxanthini]USQ77604.1 ABC transporter permease [Ornithinimicrobium cryptoxanthini]